MRATNGTGGTGGDIGVAAGACVAGGAGIYGAAQTSQTGPIIAGVVALIVALVTWYATDRRQAKALEAENIRLERQLEAERERQAQVLKQDRETTELAELRRVLADATEKVLSANAQLYELRLAWDALPPNPSAAGVAQLQKMYSTAGASVIAVRLAWYTVTLRLGERHPVVWKLDLVQGELGVEHQEIGPLSAPPPAAQRTRLHQFDERRSTALKEFREAAFEAVGSRL
jgi:hypothetical protein